MGCVALEETQPVERAPSGLACQHKLFGRGNDLPFIDVFIDLVFPPPTKSKCLLTVV